MLGQRDAVKVTMPPCSSPHGKTPRFSVHWDETVAVEKIPRYAVLRDSVCEAG